MGAKQPRAHLEIGADSSDKIMRGNTKNKKIKAKSAYAKQSWAGRLMRPSTSGLKDKS